MQLDRNMLNRLLAMDDAQLEALIRKIAKEANIDPAVLGINPENIQSIRTALGSADDGDLAKMTEILDSYQKARRGRK